MTHSPISANPALAIVRRETVETGNCHVYTGLFYQSRNHYAAGDGPAVASSWKKCFALRALVAGECVLEYKGVITGWRETVRRHRRAGIEGHTFMIGLSDGRVIDGVVTLKEVRRTKETLIYSVRRSSQA